MRGEVEVENKVLVVKRIHVIYKLQASSDDRETIERVHAMHQDFCPIYRSIYKAIDVSTEIEITKD